MQVIIYLTIIYLQSSKVADSKIVLLKLILFGSFGRVCCFRDLRNNIKPVSTLGKTLTQILLH